MSGAAAPDLSADRVYAGGYLLYGGFRLSCWIRLYLQSLVGCCFELYDAAVPGAALPALSAEGVGTPSCTCCAVVFVFRNQPWTIFHPRHITALSLF